MILMVKVFILLTTARCVLTQGREIGQQCTLKNGVQGICESIEKCESAQENLKKKITPIHCRFVNDTPVVCCETILKSAKTPRISEQKCREYLSLTTPQQFMLGGGGVDAAPKEFPHMSLLGYGKNASVAYQCGGSLISEQFILTAAHCLESRELGPVRVVRIGDLDTASDKDDASPQEFSVIKTYQHPDYTIDSFYNDIAILKLVNQ